MHFRLTRRALHLDEHEAATYRPRVERAVRGTQVQTLKLTEWAEAQVGLVPVCCLSGKGFSIFVGARLLWQPLTPLT